MRSRASSRRVARFPVSVCVPAETHDPDACESQNDELAGGAVPIVRTEDGAANQPAARDGEIAAHAASCP